MANLSSLWKECESVVIYGGKSARLPSGLGSLVSPVVWPCWDGVSSTDLSCVSCYLQPLQVVVKRGCRMTSRLSKAEVMLVP